MSSKTKAAQAAAKARWEKRPIENFPGYAIDSMGVVWCRRKRGPHGGFGKWRKINPSPNNKGYLYVTCSIDGERKRFYVHTLVLTAFIGPRPTGKKSRHLDGNQKRNWVSNLAWGTQVENEADKLLHGRRARGERNGTAKLRNGQIKSIRAALAKGTTGKSLATKFNVSVMTISLIRNRKIWKHV